MDPLSVDLGPSPPTSVQGGGTSPALGAASAGVTAVDVTHGQPFTITAHMQQKYAKLFLKHDPQKTGVVSGAVAAEIMKKSKLPADRLGQIWALCDRQNRGCLSFPEFMCAIHLISKARKGVSVEQMPPELDKVAQLQLDAAKVIDPHSRATSPAADWLD